jgi:hypothetical protein
MRGRRREVREVESSRRVEAWSVVADRVRAATNQHRPKADRREGGGVDRRVDDGSTWDGGFLTRSALARCRTDMGCRLLNGIDEGCRIVGV